MTINFLKKFCVDNHNICVKRRSCFFIELLVWLKKNEVSHMCSGFDCVVPVQAHCSRHLVGCTFINILIHWWSQHLNRLLRGRDSRGGLCWGHYGTGVIRCRNKPCPIPPSPLPAPFLATMKNFVQQALPSRSPASPLQKSQSQPNMNWNC